MTGTLLVRMGEYAVADARDIAASLSVRGLGSCIALFLHEPVRQVGGMAHIMLPEPAPRSPLRSPARFAVTAVGILLDALERAGARRNLVTAKLCGGAHLFGWKERSPDRDTLGERNIEATLRALRDQSVPVLAMDVGGASGRSLVADVTSGAVTVRVYGGELRRV